MTLDEIVKTEKDIILMRNVLRTHTEQYENIKKAVAFSEPYLITKDRHTFRVDDILEDSCMPEFKEILLAKYLAKITEEQAALNKAYNEFRALLAEHNIEYDSSLCRK